MNDNERLITGTVKFFNNHPEKLYGFITAEDKKEYFFHLFQGRGVDVGRGGLFEYPFKFAQPKPGDKVVFRLALGKRGIRAGSWYFAREYEEALAKIERNRRFRIVDPDNGEKILWEGKDESELVSKFPSHVREETFHATPKSLRFQKMDPVGDWYDWQAPRALLSKLPRIRVITITKFNKSSSESTRTVLWAGSEADLNRKFPLRIGAIDFLSPDSDKEFETSYAFEMLSSFGRWEKYSDPRHPVHSAKRVLVRC